MDTRLQNMIREARSEGSFAAWLAAAHAARSANEPLEEAVLPLIAGSRDHQSDLDVESLVFIDELHELLSKGPVKGSLVEYTNKRARAKYKESKERVEVGTRGQVVWSGSTRYGASVGVRHNDEAFFTNPDNLTVLAFQTVLRRDEARAHVDKHWEKEVDYWVSYPRRVCGYSVIDDYGNYGTIFWAKWQGGELRIGYGTGARGRSHWNTITAVKPAWS